MDPTLFYALAMTVQRNNTAVVAAVKVQQQATQAVVALVAGSSPQPATPGGVNIVV